VQGGTHTNSVALGEDLSERILDPMVRTWSTRTAATSTSTKERSRIAHHSCLEMLGVGRRVLEHTTRAACAASFPVSALTPLAVSASATSAFHCCGPRLADVGPSSSTTSFGAYAAVRGSDLAPHPSAGPLLATLASPVTWFRDDAVRLAQRLAAAQANIIRPWTA
jgi:hypothetical protein